MVPLLLLLFELKVVVVKMKAFCILHHMNACLYTAPSHVHVGGSCIFCSSYPMEEKGLGLGREKKLQANYG